MSEEVKAAFGGYMGAYYHSLVPRTKSMQEYITRGLATSIVLAPSRMVDLAEEMLAAWQRNGGPPGNPSGSRWPDHPPVAGCGKI